MITLYPITSFSLLGLNLSVHGLFMALGALTGWVAAKRPARKCKLVFKSRDGCRVRCVRLWLGSIPHRLLAG